MRRGARAVRSLTPDVRTWTPEQRDTVVYACGAVFALATIRLSTIELYRQWAEIAIGPYVVGAFVSAMTVRRARRRARSTQPQPSQHLRVAIFLFVLAGATFLPLTLEVFLQSQTGGTTHVQPEVLVVERSGKAVAAGKDPYPAVVVKHPTGQTAAELQRPALLRPVRPLRTAHVACSASRAAGTCRPGYSTHGSTSRSYRVCSWRSRSRCAEEATNRASLLCKV